jgi:hypothetical protein
MYLKLNTPQNSRCTVHFVHIDTDKLTIIRLVLGYILTIIKLSLFSSYVYEVYKVQPYRYVQQNGESETAVLAFVHFE